MDFKIKLPKFKFGSKKTVIDWGASSLKVVTASKQKNSFLINDFFQQEAGDDLTSELSSIWKKKKFPSTNIVLSLDGSSTLVRVVDFPRMDKKAIADSLNYELSRYVPFSQEEVYFDFEVLEDNPSSDNLRLLIAVAKKEIIDEKLSILDEIGLVPSKITLSPVSLVNAFLNFFPHEGGAVGILDLGFSYSMISIINNNKLYLSREVKKGAKDILQRVSNLMGTKINNLAELEEKNENLDHNFISDVSSDLVEEIKISLDYLETKENLIVKKIYFTGGLTCWKGISNVLGPSLEIDAVPFEILNFFSCSESIKEQLKVEEGNFSVAISSLL